MLEDIVENMVVLSSVIGDASYKVGQLTILHSDIQRSISMIDLLYSSFGNSFDHSRMLSSLASLIHNYHFSKICKIQK